ncbi:M48 family metalloprotease [Xanthomonas hortorum pv. pelargonii]
MTTATRLQLQATVDAIAAHAYIAPPRVRLWRHRNARYNALTHTIAVSQTLALTLDANQRYTLLAHEVGHAQRRATMLKRVGSYFWPPALALVVGAMTAAAVGSFAAKPLPQTLCALVLGIVAAVVAGQLAERTDRRARRDSYAEELRADRFANRMAGDPAAMTAVLHACARIKDGGELGAEAERRIAFARDSSTRTGQSRPSVCHRRRLNGPCDLWSQPIPFGLRARSVPSAQVADRDGSALPLALATRQTAHHLRHQNDS